MDAIASTCVFAQGAAYVYERGLLPVYTQCNKLLVDLGEKHPELKKIPFYPQKKGVGACCCCRLSMGTHRSPQRPS